MLSSIAGGYNIRTEDQRIISAQRAITKQVNDKFIQIGAIFLKMNGKNPIDEDWAQSQHRDTRLDEWIDNPDMALHNVGFNLQLGWMDIDIDVEDPRYNRCLLAALDHLGVDTRFRFGRRSVGFPTHALVQLSEGEANNFEHLKKFEPREFRIGGKRFKTQLRSFPTNTEKANALKAAQQTVMPGSIYSHKTEPGEYDLSVWYRADGSVASDIAQVAATTPRRASYSQVIRAIAFATLLYLVEDKWVEGERQSVATRIAGWLARVVAESQAMNNHEVISSDVFCPVDDDSIVESLFAFIGSQMGDEEVAMRVRTYYDAQGKLQRNPDAKIPGWPSMEAMFGGECVQALRAVFTPGSDVSILTVMAERYVYDETDNTYVDRRRHLQDGKFTHGNEELRTRHKGDVVRIGGKPREAFGVFESSDMRKRVDRRDLYPDLEAGQIYRIGLHEEILPDEVDEDGSMVIFNTWRGWPIGPTLEPDAALMEECIAKLDQLLAYMTQDNPDQAHWIKQWVAWTFQYPGRKQQIAPVIIGGQGVGKSFFGNVFLKALMGRLWGTASPKVMEGGFSVEPFIDKMFVFIDEAKFHGDSSTDEIKKVIRNTDIGGAEKFGSARNYRIFSRVAFASNRFDIGVGQAGMVDRALFYIKTYDKDYKKCNEFEFKAWAETLKPWFEEYAAFLNRRVVREHYIKYFLELPVTKQEVESLKYSSADDPTIVTSNMTWPRRIAKKIIEEGYIIEATGLECPFLDADLDARVQDLTQKMGMRSVQGSRVMAELEGADLVERIVHGMRKYRRFKHKLGTTTQLFGDAIGVKLDSMFEFDENDYGENPHVPGDRVMWKGQKATKF